MSLTNLDTNKDTQRDMKGTRKGYKTGHKKGHKIAVIVDDFANEMTLFVDSICVYLM